MGIASFEFIQWYDLGSSYFGDLMNWVDMISITLILFIMTSNDFFDGKTLWKEWQSIVAVISIGFTWYKFFYWMKLFKSTSFFINLLSRTFSDKNFRAFTVMMIILICGFSNLVYIFNKTRGVREKDGEFWKDYKTYDSEGTINDEIFVKNVDSDFFNSLFWLY